ncbi:ribonuclease Z [Zhouia spongiae]|uniref:Ribonuclease Z n=1 Tax=Zhouia spongiae TaxID=2202721 RepID=A0ABY3YM23_9FLAO|nr:ribonuclease Z [Zhouia spongiae]UNY98665.1 ribonuclease Z [Zhouia spongiae]
MIFDKQGNTTVATQEAVSLATFLSRLNESQAKWKNDNLIINLLSITKIEAGDLLELLPLHNKHTEGKKSFVIVSNAVNFNDVHNDLIVVPTLKEAFDIIEMDEIERDLDL